MQLATKGTISLSRGHGAEGARSSRKELVALARIGALNSIGDVEHRRDALWQVEHAGRPVGPLLRPSLNDAETDLGESGAPVRPLRRMSTEERITADLSGTGITTGPHPMAYHRARLRASGMIAAGELAQCCNDQRVCITGCVIARQRPGTAKGFVFLSLEDETGIANVIVTPDAFEQNRVVITRSRYLEVEGRLQRQDGVIHVKARYLRTISITSAEVRSHDFH